MSFTRANALGWALYEVLTSTQMNHIDSQLPDALDANGGSYALAADLILAGGAGAFRTDKAKLEPAGTLDIDATASVTYAGTNTPKLASRSIAILQPLVPVENSSSRFTYNSSPYGWQQGDVTSIGNLRFDLARYPAGATLTQAVAYCAGGLGTGGAHSALPATLPSIRVKSVSLADGSETTLGGNSDASATLAAYDAMHPVSIGSLAKVLDTASQVFVEFSGETGANSQSNSLVLFGLKVWFTVTALQP